MKLKSKLIASIMSICLVCAVFAIGVFALKTANLKIGGDVSFTATGVEATIEKFAVTANTVADEASHFAKVDIDTTKTQSAIDTGASSWSGLNITIGESGVANLDVSVTNNADETTEKGNYIEMDSNVNLGTGNNIDISMKPLTVGETVSDYIIAPGDTEYYRITFKVIDDELNASLENFAFNLVLNHAKAVSGTLNGTKLTGTDGVVYTLNNDGTASLSTTLINVGDNYYYDGDPNLKISPVVTDGNNHYIVTTIGNSAFYSDDEAYGNAVIENLLIPNSVISIGSDAFWNCVNLRSLTIPDSVISVGLYAFDGCTSLQSITIGNGIEYFDSDVFRNTAWYNAQEDGVVYAGKVAYGYKGTMPPSTSITLEKGTSVIARFAFNGCKNLTSIVVPDSVTSICELAFKLCSSLSSVKIDSQTVVSGLTSLTAQQRLIENATSIYVKASLDVTSATYLTNTENFTPEKNGSIIKDVDGDGYILYTKVA